MSKTNTENTIPEIQAPETAGGLPLDVRVRPRRYKIIYRIQSAQGRCEHCRNSRNHYD